MPTKNSRGKIILSPEDKKFLQENYLKMTNKELANALGLNLTKTRGFLYEMDLKRMELEYWTEEQIKYLLDNYKEIGDVELAEIFNSKWKKNKGWSKKHIEKKRKYLKLNRTQDERHQIYLRNKILGRWKMCPVKAWETRGGSAEIGHVFWWRNNSSGRKYPVIKTENGYFTYYRHIWIEKFGKLPSDKYVVPKIDAPENILLTIEDLEVIDRFEHQKRNAERRMQVPSELREIIRLKNKISKTIKKQEND